jgi:hypothetical protein
VREKKSERERRSDKETERERGRKMSEVCEREQDQENILNQTREI